MSTNNIITFAHLLDWIEGRLSAEDAANIEKSMTTATASQRADLAWLTAFHRLSQETVLATLPDGARANLAARFSQYAENRHRSAAERPGFLQRMMAALTFDSVQQPMPEGLRSSDKAQLRQLVYSVDAVDIVLNIQPRSEDDGFDLLGQILPKRADFDLTTSSIQLRQKSGDTIIDVPDELGEFSFQALSSSGNSITVSSDTMSIAVPLPELHG